jgi:mRNA interferase MazF
VRRGEIWWASLGAPSGSEPGYRRPVLVVSANRFNDSPLKTVLVIPVTSSLRLADLPGNIRLPVKGTGLREPSVAIGSQINTANKLTLTERIGRVPDDLMNAVDAQLRLVLGL